MGLISKATWLGVGYVLGARAGTARYEQIAAAASKFANRPELQPYLGWLTRPAPPDLDASSPAPAAPPAPVTPRAPVTSPAPVTPPAPVTSPAPVIRQAPVVPPAPVAPLIVDPPVVEPPAPVVTVTRRSRPGRWRNR